MPGTCDNVNLHSKRDFDDVTLVVYLKVRKLSWIIGEGSIYSHEPLKAEKSSAGRRRQNRDNVRKNLREILSGKGFDILLLALRGGHLKGWGEASLRS